MDELAAQRLALAREVLNRLGSIELDPSLEVEVRLCKFANERRPSDVSRSMGAAADKALRIVSAKVVPGVGANDFSLIEAFCVSKSQEGGVSRSITCDVKNKGLRYTFTGEDCTTCIECTDKKKLFSVDVLVPFGAYNIRISVSKEKRIPVPERSVTPKTGFKRKKDRLSIVDGSFRYDLTKVTENGATVYEVEVEGMFSSSEDVSKQLTEQWIDQLLDKALTLATLTNRRA
ncbi:putative RNA triphosphatase [Trypanosoma vivax]|nr:putative RNA triphosphatase [Trypanosoma vivax]